MCRLIAILLLSVFPALELAWSSDQTNAVRPSVSVAPPTAYDPATLERFDAELAGARAQDPFTAEIVFETPVAVGALQSFAEAHGVSRILGLVNYQRYDAPGRESSTMVGLGAWYAADRAWQFTVCQSLLFTSVRPANSLQRLEFSNWPVSSANVHAAAGAMRQLLTHSKWRAHVVSGKSISERAMRAMEAYVAEKTATPIDVPANRDVPEACRSLVQTKPAPILVTGYDSSARSLPRRPAESDTAYALRVIQSLEPAEAVTLSVVLDRPVLVDELGAMVTRFQLDGLLAQFTPAEGHERVMRLAELSVHGGAMADAVRRFRCQPQNDSAAPGQREWVSQQLTVSAPAARIGALLSYPGIDRATVDGVFPPEALRSLVAYYGSPERRTSADPGQCDAPLP